MVMVIIIFCVSNKKINLGVFCAVAMAFFTLFRRCELVEKIKVRRQEVSYCCFSDADTIQHTQLR